MIGPDSPLVAPPSGTLAAALAYAEDDDDPFVMQYARELFRLAPLVSLDPAVLFAQAAHETAGFTSFYWRTRLNPAGIGITGDPAQNAASQTWATGTDAARGHVLHMWIYTQAGEPTSETIKWLFAGRYDIRALHAIDQPWSGEVRTIRDLTGKWATDPAYHDKIVRKHAAIFGETVSNPRPSGGSMPDKPVIYDLMRDYARFGISGEDAATVRAYRFENRQGYSPSFIVLHIQAGTTRSSLDWWANGYVDGAKVTASSTVMIQRDGSILQVIPEQHAPWTNGDDNRPTTAGLPLVQMPGNSNLHTLSIEAEGMSGADVLNYPAQLDAIEWQVRDWMARYPIPISNVIRHGDVNSVDRPNCPGAYYPVIMARLAKDPTPEQPQPSAIWWKPGTDYGPQKRAHDGAIAIAFQGEVRAKRNVPLRKDAHAKAAVVHRLQTGETARIVGTYVAANKTRWAFIEFAPGKVGRAPLSAFDPYRWPTV